MLLVSGMSASGKTTLVEQLASEGNSGQFRQTPASQNLIESDLPH
jgi:molybdopterin-guanine dinucleotide biosynthesis protein